MSEKIGVIALKERDFLAYKNEMPNDSKEQFIRIETEEDILAQPLEYVVALDGSESLSNFKALSTCASNHVRAREEEIKADRAKSINQARENHKASVNDSILESRKKRGVNIRTGLKPTI